MSLENNLHYGYPRSEFQPLEGGQMTKITVWGRTCSGKLTFTERPSGGRMPRTDPDESPADVKGSFMNFMRTNGGEGLNA